MNVEYANAIPLRTVFDKAFLQPKLQSENILIFASPFRLDNEYSLVVDLITNTWHDTVDKKGGNVIDFVRQYLQSKGKQNNITAALRWLSSVVGYVILECPEGAKEYDATDKYYKVKEYQHLSTPVLIEYVESKGIPYDYARFVLNEVKVRNAKSKRTFWALGIKNEDRGYYIFNPYLSGNVGMPYLTFIRGQVDKPSGVHIFENVIDYLSVITRRKGKPFVDDVIILNSYQNMKLSGAFIRGYGYANAYTWLENTPIGFKALKNYSDFFKSEDGLAHKPMNKLYITHKSVNSWHQANLSSSSTSVL